MSIPPGVRRRQQQVARWARHTPGYRFALEQVLPRVRRNAVLTDLAWRVFAPRHGAGNVDVALLPDRQLSGPDVGRVPVVGVLATGLDEEQAVQLLADLADLQQQTGSFRPLLILDRPVFAAGRRHGFVVEHVIPEQEWASGDFGEVPWADYLARRLASVIDHYQFWHLARAQVPADGGRVWLDRADEALLRVLGERLTELDLASTDPPQPRP